MAIDGASDAELTARAAAGDEPAFTALMRRHKDRLYRVIRHYVGDGDEAYDLLQESFVAAWRALARYDPARPFPAWLTQIAITKCRDWSRRRAVRRLIRPLWPANDAEAESVPDPEASPETLTADRQALRDLDRAIAALPPKLKEPLILTALDGLSHAEAAAILGTTAKAIEVRVYRARAALKAAL